MIVSLWMYKSSEECQRDGQSTEPARFSFGRATYWMVCVCVYRSRLQRIILAYAEGSLHQMITQSDGAMCKSCDVPVRGTFFIIEFQVRNNGSIAVTVICRTVLE